MKNKEKFAKDILEIACNGDAIAVSKTTGKPNRCGNVGCEDCMRYTGRPGCAEKRLREWAESERTLCRDGRASTGSESQCRLPPSGISSEQHD